MIIELNISDQQKLDALIQLLQSMDFITSIRLVPEEMPNRTEEPENKSSKYWGAWKNTSLSIEQIDTQIAQIREEWQRDIN